MTFAVCMQHMDITLGLVNGPKLMHSCHPLSFKSDSWLILCINAKRDLGKVVEWNVLQEVKSAKVCFQVIVFSEILYPNSTVVRLQQNSISRSLYSRISFFCDN